MPEKSRRQLLGMIGVAVAGGSALTVACGSRPAVASGPAGGTAAGASGGASGGADTIMVVRHAEKPVDDGAPYGVTADGEKSDGSLTIRGWTRAGALVELFAPAAGAAGSAGTSGAAGASGVAVRAGLVRPDAVYAAKPDGDKSQRPAQTATPVAARLGVKLNLDHAKGEEDALVKAVAARHGATLVSWQHEEIPDIAAHLGTVTPTPPKSWPDDRFDVVWVFTRAGGGWTFSQVPQLLLDGDRQDVIH